MRVTEVAPRASTAYMAPARTKGGELIYRKSDWLNAKKNTLIPDFPICPRTAAHPSVPSLSATTSTTT